MRAHLRRRAVSLALKPEPSTVTVVAPPTTPTAERERWHGTRERVVGQHARRDDARAAAAVPSSEKPFSGSAPPQKQQRASSLAATESAASPFVAPLTSAARAANKKPAPAIVTTVPSRTSPTAGVAAAGASVGGVWYANETPSARRVWRRAAWRG